MQSGEGTATPRVWFHGPRRCAGGEVEHAIPGVPRSGDAGCPWRGWAGGGRCNRAGGVATPRVWFHGPRSCAGGEVEHAIPGVPRMAMWVARGGDGQVVGDAIGRGVNQLNRGGRFSWMARAPSAGASLKNPSISSASE